MAPITPISGFDTIFIGEKGGSHEAAGATGLRLRDEMSNLSVPLPAGMEMSEGGDLWSLMT